MAEILTVLGVAIVIFGIFVFFILLMSFIFWENGFRVLKSPLFLRVFVAVVICVWLVNLIPGGK